MARTDIDFPGDGNATLPAACPGAILIANDAGEFEAGVPMLNEDGELLFTEDCQMIVVEC